MCVYTHIYVSVCIYGGGTEIEKEVIYLCNKYFCRIVKNILYKCFSIRYYMVTLSVVEEGTLYFRVVYKMSSYATVWIRYQYIWQQEENLEISKKYLFISVKCAAAAAAKSLQSCPTLCDPRDGSPPGSPVPGILQARTLEWVAISFSNAWKWKVKVKSLCRARLLATPWTAAHQAPPSMGFSRQEYWSGVPLPSPS